jgi:hypothetical protein
MGAASLLDARAGGRKEAVAEASRGCSEDTVRHPSVQSTEKPPVTPRRNDRETTVGEIVVARSTITCSRTALSTAREAKQEKRSSIGPKRRTQMTSDEVVVYENGMRGIDPRHSQRKGSA